MDIKKLRMFHEVFITGSITLAAERLYVSQPAASKTISALEEEIGYKLFVRKSGHLCPTDEAYYLHEEVLLLLQNFKRLEENVKSAKHHKSGKLKIGSGLGPGFNFLPKILSQYMKINPDIKINLHLLNSSAIREAVSTGQFHIGLLDKSGPTTRYDSKVVNMTCYCAVHCDHPAAKLDKVTPIDLDNTPWINLDPEHTTTKDLIKTYAKHGTRFNPIIEVDTTLQALSFVNYGMGVALIDSLNKLNLLEMLNHKNIKLIPFEPVIFEQVEVITANIKPMSKMVQHFYDFMIGELEKII
ncbi:MAG: DNA-binding transcriptional LysR family regulator [Paraglaciecola sp.]|jgi:DNA-binding transcriptional LysR family regulator